MALRAILAALLLSMLLLGGVASYYATVRDDGVGLQFFSSRAAFQSYVGGLQERHLDHRAAEASNWFGGFQDTLSAGAMEGGFSGTNVQVAGVDEADVVKTDGQFLYLVAGRDVVLVRARPATEMSVVSRISGSDLVGDRNVSHRIVGLFLFDKTLVVITSLHPFQVREWTVAEVAGSGGVTLSLFSVEEPASPTLLHEFELTGEYRASRMKEGTVYLVLHQYLWTGQEEATYPAICEDGRCRDYEAGRIHYDAEAQDGGSLTNVVALDLRSGETGYLSVLTGFASTVYMSPASLYVTFAKSRQVTIPLIGGTWESITSIYRIEVEGTRLHPAAGGNVRGWLLNQFSLDEHEGHLRVATTTGGMNPTNHVYVLDEAMEVRGALEGLAPGESIYSARFVGDLGYLVTFQKVDPFFVLDLSDPRRPEVLGYLKIPGFSQYLHPADETHILGVGKDALEDPSGQFAWFQGLKLSLFDVSDLRQPKEVAKLLVGDRGSSSPVLYDHKAFLYMREARLAVLPVDLVSNTEPPRRDDVPPWAIGMESWQGALVLSVSPEGGFEVLSRITHVPGGGDSCSFAHGPYAVIRSLYIGEYLYTISASTLKAHALADFSEAGSLIYNDPTDSWACEGIQL